MSGRNGLIGEVQGIRCLRCMAQWHRDVEASPLRSDQVARPVASSFRDGSAVFAQAW